MLILGVGFVWWHFRTPTKDGLSPKEPTGYESPLMWLWFRNTPKRKVRSDDVALGDHTPTEVRNRRTNSDNHQIDGRRD